MKLDILVGSCVLAIVASIGLLIWYIPHGSADVVYSDTWGFVPMLHAFFNDTLTWKAVWAGHNENRPIILDGFLILSANLDNFNQIHLEYLGAVFCLLTYFQIVKESFWIGDTFPKAVPVALAATAVLMFSLSQWENFLLSVNCVFFLTVLAATLAITSMARHLSGHSPNRPRTWFLASVFWSEVALFSMGGGVVIWPLILLQLIATASLSGHQVRWVFGIYLLVGAISLFLYSRGLEHAINFPYVFHHPLDLLKFIVIGLGNSVVGVFNNQKLVQLDFVVGLMLLVIYSICGVALVGLHPNERVRLLPLVFILLFGLAEQFLIALGRLPLGLDNAATSRYATLTLISLPSALMLLIATSRRRNINLIAAGALASIIFVFSAAADYSEIRMSRSRQEYSLNLQSVLRNGHIGTPELVKLQWAVRSDVLEGNHFLRARQLSLYKAGN